MTSSTGKAATGVINIAWHSAFHLSIKSRLKSKIPIAWAGWDFAQLLNGVPEGQQTNSDVIQIKALANTNTATWPDEFAKVYFNNYLASQENEDCIIELDFEVAVINEGPR